MNKIATPNEIILRQNQKETPIEKTKFQQWFRKILAIKILKENEWTDNNKLYILASEIPSEYLFQTDDGRHKFKKHYKDLLLKSDWMIEYTDATGVGIKCSNITIDSNHICYINDTYVISLLEEKELFIIQFNHILHSTMNNKTKEVHKIIIPEVMVEKTFTQPYNHFLLLLDFVNGYSDWNVKKIGSTYEITWK